MTIRDGLTRITAFAVGFCALPLLGLGLCTAFDPCENDVVTHLVSPSGAQKAVVFLRGCGATTATSVQVSILTAENPAPSGVGNMRSDPRLRVFKRETHRRGVTLRYANAPVPSTFGR